MRAKLIYNSLVQYMRKTLSNWLNKKGLFEVPSNSRAKNDSFIKYLLTTYYVTGTVLCPYPEVIAVSNRVSP